MNNINNQIRHFKLRESKRKLVGLEITRRKRAELNDLINKEVRIKNGAENLLSACNNTQTQERLRLEITFAESKIEYLKDQLAELNCDFTLYKMKNLDVTSSSRPPNSLSCSSATSAVSSSSSKSLSSSKSSSTSLSPPLHQIKQFTIIPPKILVTPSTNEPYESFKKCEFIPNNQSLSLSPSSSSSSYSSNGSPPEPQSKPTSSHELMIYLNLKETYTKLDFSKGFCQVISNHYRENPSNYSEQIRQFNYFRESTIRLSYEPSLDSIKRLFEYFNSLFLIEKRFFHSSKCDHVQFAWCDSMNGVESVMKSIEFEKAAIIFNCATLFTQLAAICCDGNEQKLEDQLIYWLKATGCLSYLYGKFSCSPNLDMSSFVLCFFIEAFKCQAYETKAKMFISNSTNESARHDPKRMFLNFTNSAKIYSFVADSYSQIKTKLDNNAPIKNYLPEIWYNLIKVKSIHYKGLSHYFAALAILTPGIESVYDNLEVQISFDSLHERSVSKSKTMQRQTSGTYFHKKMIEQQQLYETNALRDEKKFHLAKAHIREAIIWHEEAIRQHSLCRKFTKNDYLHNLLRYHHDLSLDKFMKLENISSESFDSELFDVFPISTNMNDKLLLNPIEPNFEQFESKDFFNLIGPIKLYSTDFDISLPYTCLLKKQQSQQTFGITVKGDCPVRINQVDPKSQAYNIGIRAGDYIIAIQDQDVRWSKHCQVVEKIRAYSNYVKLTMISTKPRPREVPIMCHSDENEQYINTNKLSTVSSPPMTQRVRHRLFKSPQSPGTIKLAASRLFNFVKSDTHPTDTVSSNIPKLNQAPILFNKEDDEIYNDRDNLKFWHHLKSVKLPTLTNTITLGRKFKSNVLKMSIFNTFSAAQSDLHDQVCPSFARPENTSLKILNNFENTNASQALKDLFANELAKKSYSRNKLLRNNKHKKLLQKTIESMSKDLNSTNISSTNNHNKNNNNNNNNNNTNARLLSYQSNLYKTL